MTKPEQVATAKKEFKNYNIVSMRAERTLIKGILAPDTITLEHAFGIETQRRNSLHRMNDSKLLTITGNALLMIDLNTMEQDFLIGIDGGGIGAIAVHPSGTLFAVGEKGTNPNVYVYEYPEIKLVRVLRNGTERAYSDMRFSKDGSKLATVGGAPDYLLYIWDWENEAVLLRTKAFSQDVFCVSFSPRFDGTLYTSGTGHIRFWKMASTFTGLKLQGEIGKFGAIELSDISAYLELADGKVLSGTESGTLLVWDGGLVKVEVTRKDKSCHEGMVEMLWVHEDHILSAGQVRACACVSLYERVLHLPW
jgi:WD40 repeat protein